MCMKADLLRKISSLNDFESPDIRYEQYMTPPQLAADMVFTAYMQGHIDGKRVVDLGSGTGILGISASLLGGDVDAVEIDSSAMEIAEENAESLSADVNFVESDIADFEGEYDTCVMNPPFSVHSEEGKMFVEKAFEIADNIYTLGSDKLLAQIKDLAASYNYKVESEKLTISLPATYGFHTEEGRETELNLIYARPEHDGN